MTGASRADWLRYRALWFSLLNQGFKRAGTANSDSHSLSNERIGYPRNLVWGGHDQGTFDFDSFDADVRAGHLEGTNGPVIDVTIDDGAPKIYRPDMAPITVSATATLKISVAAAPWIPVTEARVFVNGALVHTFDLSSLFPSGDPFGTRISSGTSACSSPRCSPPGGTPGWSSRPGSTRTRRPTPTVTVCPICRTPTCRRAPARRSPLQPASHRARRLADGVQQSVLPRPRRRRLDGAGPAVRRTVDRGAARLPSVVRGGRRARRAGGSRLSGPIRGSGRAARGRDASRTAGRLRRRPGRLPGLRSLAPPARRALRRKRSARLRGAHHRQRDRPRAAANQRAERDLASPSISSPTATSTMPGWPPGRPRSGPRRVGYHLVLASGARATIAAYLRALLPLDTARAKRNRDRARARAPAAGRGSAGAGWPMEGYRWPARSSSTGGQAHGQLQPAALAEVWFAPRPAFALFAGGSSGGGRADVLADQRHAARRHALGAGARSLDGVSGRSPGGGGRPHQRHRQPVLGLDPEKT